MGSIEVDVSMEELLLNLIAALCARSYFSVCFCTASIGLTISPAELRWRRRFAPAASPTPGPAARPRLFRDTDALAERLAAEGLVKLPPSRKRRDQTATLPPISDDGEDA